VGVPQGGIVSPLLSNLILHELDLYVEQLRLQLEKNSSGHKPTTSNKQYGKLTKEISQVRETLRKSNSKNEKILLRKSLKLVLSQRNCLKSVLPNPEYTKIKYVRYADDWLIGVWGPKTLATHLRGMIGSFLSSIGLTLSEEKTLITNTSQKPVKFLGTLIKRISPNMGNRPKLKGPGWIWMTAPLRILAKRLKEKGF
jgi:retron-type reverse transcriptase